MAILIGVHPGGKGKFAVVALYWNGRWPAHVIDTRSYSGVDDVLKNIVGTSGEWGELTYAAIAAPLTWSGSPSGWRTCDKEIAQITPPWTPSSWLRAPNTLPGAISVQGPALTWALAQEIKQEQLPRHGVLETHPRLCWALMARQEKTAVLGYRDRDLPAAVREKHEQALFTYLSDAGMVSLETSAPRGADEIDAVICALVALGVAFPNCGIVVKEFEGGEIRPVGTRSVAIGCALP